MSEKILLEISGEHLGTNDARLILKLNYEELMAARGSLGRSYDLWDGLASCDGWYGKWMELAPNVILYAGKMRGRKVPSAERLEEWLQITLPTVLLRLKAIVERNTRQEEEKQKAQHERLVNYAAKAMLTRVCTAVREQVKQASPLAERIAAHHEEHKALSAEIERQARAVLNEAEVETDLGWCKAAEEAISPWLTRGEMVPEATTKEVLAIAKKTILEGKLPLSEGHFPGQL